MLIAIKAFYSGWAFTMTILYAHTRQAMYVTYIESLIQVNCYMEETQSIIKLIPIKLGDGLK